MAQDMVRPTASEHDVEVAEMDRALAHYRRVRAELEATSMDKYATIDADTGNFVIADTVFGAAAKFRETFGQDRPAWTLHIGTT